MNASVIIPTLNRAPSLRKTLDSLAKQNFNSSEFEILIIDNGSVDDTRLVSSAFMAEHPSLQVRYFFEPEPGLLAGRHKGFFMATGKYLVFIDDDIIAARSWLADIVAAFSNRPDIHIIGGPSLPAYEKEPPYWLTYFWRKGEGGSVWCGELSLLDLGKKEKEIDPAFVWGLNYSIRKDTLHSLGGFNPDTFPAHLQHFQGDGETGLSLKAAKKGFKALYLPGALVYHEVPAERMTISYFDRRYFFQGICDSFTLIRENKGLNKRNKSNLGLSGLRSGLKSILKGKTGSQALFSNQDFLYTRFSCMKNAGFDFHQSIVKKNPVLLDYVLRNHYLDYKLPSL